MACKFKLDRAVEILLQKQWTITRTTQADGCEHFAGSLCKRQKQRVVHFDADAELRVIAPADQRFRRTTPGVILGQR